MTQMKLTIDTLRTIREEGGGFAKRLQSGPKSFVWYAGATRLDEEIVIELIMRGYLADPNGTDHTQIIATPRFAT